MICIHRKTPVFAALLLTVTVVPARGERMSLIGSDAPGESALAVIYSSDTGGVRVAAPNGLPLTAIQLTSASGQFKPECGSINGMFDVCLPEQIFKLVPGGFLEANLGPILEPKLSRDSLLSDLLVDGASVGGGFYVGDGPLLVHTGIVPEPSGLGMLLFGMSLMLISISQTSRHAGANR